MSEDSRRIERLRKLVDASFGDKRFQASLAIMLELMRMPEGDHSWYALAERAVEGADHLISSLQGAYEELEDDDE